jgi:RNA polymerase sigma factor (sigma-70 family)
MAAEFSQRYKDIRLQVRVYLRGTFKNNIDIDEVADAVMEKVLIRWETIADPLRWAITAAKHLAVDELRKAAVVSLSHVISREVMDYGSTDQRLKLTAIMDALERLPPPERKVLTLLAWGYEVKDIADILQVSVKSVQQYLHVARKKLGRILLYSRRRAQKSRRSGPMTGSDQSNNSHNEG